MGWWQEACFRQRCAVSLVDVSTEWLSCRVAARPSKLTTSQLVWLRPRGASQAAWTEGRIIAVRKPLFGKCKAQDLIPRSV